jgi:biopolymer transport protein ExbD
MSTTGEGPQTRRGWRRWYQFGLRALLIVTALIAILIMWQRARIEAWLAAFNAPRPVTPDLVSVTITPTEDVLLDGEMLQDNLLAARFASRLTELQQAGIPVPKAIVEASPGISIRRIFQVERAMQRAGWRDIWFHIRGRPQPANPVPVATEEELADED